LHHNLNYPMRRNHVHSLSLVIFTTFLIGCGNNTTQSLDANGDPVLKGTINISGAFALYPLAALWVENFNKEYPEVRINLSAGGAGKGMTDVLSGLVDLGMISRDIAQAEFDQGAYPIPVVMDAVFPTINTNNPAFAQLMQRGITQDEFKKIFVDGSITRWDQLVGGGGAIKVFTRSDASGAADVWAAFVGAKQEDLLGIGIFGDPGLADAVRKDPGGIGFNNTVYLYDLKTDKPYPGIAVLPIDLNANGTIDTEENFYQSYREVQTAVAESKYPSPPSRELYFVSKGQSDNPAVKAFLYWVLTKGQEQVLGAGYVPLEPTKFQQQLDLLSPQ